MLLLDRARHYREGKTDRGDSGREKDDGGRGANAGNLLPLRGIRMTGSIAPWLNPTQAELGWGTRQNAGPSASLGMTGLTGCDGANVFAVGGQELLSYHSGYSEN